MKLKFLFTGLFLLPLLSNAAVMEGRESGGGDTYALEFVQVAQQVSQHLKIKKVKQIVIQSLDEAITKTTIESTDQNLRLNGKPKDAINYPNEKKIVFNRSRWDKLTLDMKPALVLHEYLGILRIDDTGYAISRQLIGAFRYYGTPEENFRRGALAATKVFPVLEDRYAGGRGVGFIELAEITTDVRSRNDRMLVIGLPDGASDTVKSTVDVELDAIESVRIHGTDLVVSGQRYDWNEDSTSHVEVRIQIKKTAGSDDYLAKLFIRRN